MRRRLRARQQRRQQICKRVAPRVRHEARGGAHVRPAARIAHALRGVARARLRRMFSRMHAHATAARAHGCRAAAPTRLGQQQLGVRALAAAGRALRSRGLHDRLHHLRRGQLLERQRDRTAVRLQRVLAGRVCVRKGAQRRERQPLARHARLRHRRRRRAAALRRGIEPGRGPGVAHTLRREEKGVRVWHRRCFVS